MSSRCCVPNCDSHCNGKSVEGSSKVSFHRLPRDPQTLQLWLDIIGIEIQRRDDDKNSFFRICSKHFEKQYLRYTSPTRKLLRANAIPTLFIPRRDAKLKPPILQNRTREKFVDVPQERSEKVVTVLINKSEENDRNVALQSHKTYSGNQVQTSLKSASTNSVRKHNNFFGNHKTSCVKREISEMDGIICEETPNSFLTVWVKEDYH